MAWGPRRRTRRDPAAAPAAKPALVPNARLRVVPHARHGLPFSHARSEAEALVAFLAEIEAGRNLRGEG
ncbi:MAG: hypothetical protein ACK4TL_16815 [Hyphomicrobiaceae bacterium]